MKSMKECPIYGYREEIVSFILRLPKQYNVVLEHLVKHGAAKSKNALIVQIIKEKLEAKVTR